MSLRQIGARGRCWWLQVCYDHTLNLLVLREHIETFPKCGMAFSHPLLKRRALQKLRERGARQALALICAGCDFPKDTDERRWAISYARQLREETTP